jgi:Xaa-Pro aminopeptidase
MLTAEGCAGRRARLVDACPSCDAWLLTTPESLAYLAGYVPSPFVFNPVESAAALFLTAERSVLFADNLLRVFSDRCHVDEVVSLEWYTGRKSAPPRRQSLAQAVEAQLPGGIRTLGVEALSHGFGLASLDLVPLDPTLRQLRRSKDPDEIALIRRSVLAGEAGHAAALERTRPGMTELDVFLLVQEAAARALGRPAAIYGDFVSGPRCEIERGGPPGPRIIEPGDLFLLDDSVVVDGYRADFTNTFAVGGEPTPRQRELEAICLEAMAAAEALLAPGVRGRDIDGALRGSLASHGVEPYFPSHSGHGLGLGHPEPPYLVRESSDSLVVGDVVALEPGLYIPGEGGMRFERNYLILPGGHERLTNHHLGLTR